MADPAPAAEQKADPTKAQYVVNLTPEQYEVSLRMPKDVPPRLQMEVGGTGTAKASFKDAFGSDVKIVSSTWSATGSVVMTADEKDPASATLEATGPGHATITVIAQSEDGASVQAHTDVMVIKKGTPAGGKIELTVQAAPAPAAAPPA